MVPVTLILLLLIGAPLYAGWGTCHSAGSAPSGAAQTITVNLTSVVSGEFVFVWAKHEGAATAITVSDGTSSFTQISAGTVNHGNGDLSGGSFYLLSSVATGTVTYTADFNGTDSRNFREIVVIACPGDSGETRSADGTSTENTGTGTALTSGAITTSGTDTIVFSTFGNYAASTTTLEQIGGTNATGRQEATGGAASAWWRILTATMSSGQGTATIGTQDWISQIFAIKSEAAGSSPAHRVIIVQ